LFDLDFCPCGQAISDNGVRRFELEAILTCKPIHLRLAGFGDAFACKQIDLLISLDVAKKGNARVESLGSELKDVVDYV
jgi:hypothetical protein